MFTLIKQIFYIFSQGWQLIEGVVKSKSVWSKLTNFAFETSNWHNNKNLIKLSGLYQFIYSIIKLKLVFYEAIRRGLLEEEKLCVPSVCGLITTYLRVFSLVSLKRDARSFSSICSQP